MTKSEFNEAQHESSPPRRVSVVEELKALLVRLHDGDEGAVPRLREILNEVPALARKFVDPAVQTERRMVQNYAGDSLLVKETMPMILKALRTELEGESPSALERLLVERVVAT